MKTESTLQNIDPFLSIWFPWYCHTGGQSAELEDLFSAFMKVT